ncbi:MAG TPA: hypothetical protein VGN37_23845 [Actinocatenispora sp.]
MGDGRPSSTKQQVDPYDLRDAANALRKRARSFHDDVLTTFRQSMGPYSAVRLDEIAAERAKRIRGKDYDKSTAEDKKVPAGATSDWLNPFGRFHEADRLMARVDDARADAITDGIEVLGELTRMADALDAAADFYEANEGTNTNLTKNLMQGFLAGRTPRDKA